MEVSIIVNILMTDKVARLDALCDVEDYEYSGKFRGFGPLATAKSVR